MSKFREIHHKMRFIRNSPQNDNWQNLTTKWKLIEIHHKSIFYANSSSKLHNSWQKKTSRTIEKIQIAFHKRILSLHVVPHSYQINIISNHNLAQFLILWAVLRFLFCLERFNCFSCKKFLRTKRFLAVSHCHDYLQNENGGGEREEIWFIIGARLDQIGRTSYGQLELVIVFLCLFIWQPIAN